MCLSIAIHRPDDVLSQGEHAGFQWMVIHNGRGYRCGYVRLPMGHPWHGMNYDDISLVAEMHGGCTFAERDEECGKGGDDDAWWIGFDCCHDGDLQDPSLPSTSHMLSLLDELVLGLGNLFSKGPGGFDCAIRTQEYVESQCQSLCDQALKATSTHSHSGCESEHA